MGYYQYRAQRQRREQYAARYAREKTAHANRSPMSPVMKVVLALVVVAFAVYVLVFNLHHDAQHGPEWDSPEQIRIRAPLYGVWLWQDAGGAPAPRSRSGCSLASRVRLLTAQANRSPMSPAMKVVLALVVVAFAVYVLVFNLTEKPDCNPNDYGVLGAPPASCHSHTP